MKMSENEAVDSILVQLGKRICYLRTLKKMTQLDLSIEAKTTTSYLSDVERGKRNPSIKVLYRLASILGVTLEELFMGIVAF